MYKTIKILQSNIQSLRPLETREELYTFLKKENIDIASIQEIWLKPTEEYRIKGYKIVKKCREEGFGGVGILIRENIDYTVLTLPQWEPIEAVAIKTKNLSTNFVIFSIYIPPDRSLCSQEQEKICEIFRYIENITDEVILAGDFNARHPLWEKGAKPCEKGKIIFTELEKSKLVLLNDGQCTTIPRINSQATAIDLSLTTPNMATIVQWNVVEQEFGSNHLLIVMEIQTETPIVRKKIKKCNIEKAIKGINDIQPQYIYNPEELQTIFEEKIEEASYIVSNKKADFLKRWWNEEVKKAYEEKRIKLKMYNKTRSLNAQIEFQKARAIFKRVVRKNKRKHDKQIKELIDESTPVQQVWNVIKGLNAALTGINRGADHSPSKNIAEEFIKKNLVEKSTEWSFKPNDNVQIHDPSMDEPFSFNEFMSVLSKKKIHSAPGVDNISYRIIKSLKLNILVEICNQLNVVWKSKIIPPRWRNSKLILIQKPNKHRFDIDSKRGIVLMNVFLKIINTMVKNRLSKFAENKGLFPHLSFGFRQEHSAISCVNYVVNSIKEAKKKKEKCVAIFLDISKAFDTVNCQTLLKILERKRIPTETTQWIYQYLKDRTVKITALEGDISANVNTGLPQGCPLSPILFNLYTADLHQLEEEDVILNQFADDFAVLVKGVGYEIIGKANRFLDKLFHALSELGLSVNPAKCVVVNFSKIPNEKINICLQGEKISVQNIHKYLGYTIDKMLTHRKHLEEISTKAAKNLNLLKMMAGRKSPASPETMLKIGNAIVRSKMEYGAVVYGNAAKTHRKRLETTLNASIRICMRYLKSTPINVILADSGQMLMEHRTEWLALKEIIKTMSGTNPVREFICKALDEEDSNGSYVTELAIENIDIMYQLHNIRTDNDEIQRLEKLKIQVETKIAGIKDSKHTINGKVWIKLFAEMMEIKYKQHKKMYTDASRSKNGTAIAAVDIQTEESVTHKTNANVSITNAELMAIREALKMCINLKYDKTVILTDSRSSCELIKQGMMAAKNYLVMDIYRLLQKIVDEKQLVVIQWIPSHVGIRGNEAADSLAKAATENSQTIFEALTLGDTISLVKNEIWIKWTDKYRKMSETTGKIHFEFMKNPGKKIWCKNLKLSAAEIISLNRIRSNHCMTKDRKHKWGWETNPNCEVCFEEENLTHILYRCSKWDTIREKYRILQNGKNLHDIFTDLIEQELKQLTSYLKEISIFV